VSQQPLTMACWFYPTSFATSITPLCLGSASPLNFYELLITSFNKRLSFRLKDSTTPVGAMALGALSVNQWYHACGVSWGPDLHVCYLDGRNRVESTAACSPTGIDATLIGAQKAGTIATPFAGRLAEVAFWNEALTDQEVYKLANGGSLLTVRPWAIQAYYPLVAGDLDAVGHNHMTPMNKPTWALPMYRAFPFERRLWYFAQPARWSFE